MKSPNGYSRAYYEAHREECIARDRAYRKTWTEEQREVNRAACRERYHRLKDQWGHVPSVKFVKKLLGFIESGQIKLEALTPEATPVVIQITAAQPRNNFRVHSWEVESRPIGV